MRFGYVKCAAYTPEIRVADCRYNAGRIYQLMQEASQEGIELLVLPELCITGYTCGDLFFQQTLLTAAEDVLLRLVEQSRGLALITVVGLPLAVEGKLYNCAAVIYEGKLLGIIPKSHIPNYAEFYEARHFAAAPEKNSTVRLAGKDVPFGTKLLFCCEEEPAFKLAVEICEDLWVGNSPSLAHVGAGATVIANLSASDEVVAKDDFRRILLRGQSAKLIAGYIYVDAGVGESSTDLVFSGHNIIAQNGHLLAESQPFGPGQATADIDVTAIAYDRMRVSTVMAESAEGYEKILFSLPQREAKLINTPTKHPFIPEDSGRREARAERILMIQASGLIKRMEHTHAACPILGISGGLDSTLALLVAARAMDAMQRDRQDIIAITMPCFGTTKRTRSNAEKLCSALGVTLRTVDISSAVRQHFKDLGHDEGDHSVLFENAQARERTQVLMDAAHQHGGLVVGTGDLSELALGWATYNGDHMSMYGVNASVPKTLIRHIVKHVADSTENAALREVLLDILSTPVSPELLPAENGDISQKTEELVGPYELHDFFLYYVLRWGFAPEKILFLAEAAFVPEYSPAELKKWLRNFYSRFFSQQFKRSCLPDGPKVGSVTLSPRGDWRMPSDAVARLWLSAVQED